jgi:hypothetical protein
MRWWRSKSRENDLERELASHLNLEAEEQLEAGLQPDQALYAAQRAFGNKGLVKEDIREAWGWTALERLSQDLRYAIRTLLKNPGFTLAAVVTLALGIGANTAMFSVVYGVLLRPLPFPGADRVALVHVHFSPQNTEYGTMSIADYLDWKTGNHAFEDPAIFSSGNWTFDLTGTGEPMEVTGSVVTENFFSVLHSGPKLGRVFQSGESAATAAPAAVLSERLWRGHFGANAAVIGQVVNLNGTQTIIVGVMPASFRLPAAAEQIFVCGLRPGAGHFPTPASRG